MALPLVATVLGAGSPAPRVYEGAGAALRHAVHPVSASGADAWPPARPARCRSHIPLPPPAGFTGASRSALDPHQDALRHRLVGGRVGQLAVGSQLGQLSGARLADGVVALAVEVGDAELELAVLHRF